ncbi:transcription antitermination factor NusB [Candidatus Gottesmanbacteria bacterium RIFCSPLOWO2_02_FULL_42_29]|uniref:Transcription antitermination factor NusB n=2 Tax=Candidatus Gottesmaniibacteriota TaxID=1752720 RepID=A0A1F6BCD1_9BACT|nr:MAG: transcription termination factor [Candidatus Gottesmanbacteria bacterium GW2011_GWC2_42_8]OGG10764.1 MAG: transcription antitermination factor NusB [Candidatus Gottesmanbacteria bacterium RIFCSPHIGHO2_01_FULL_42_27]OGG21927.1 MAG: transcription antitermination factor NusB [Candidatus Gottesmanbacteria bacterium RIFCSPHIGHO2_12_FULL_43_26]OGG34177.1 MAG: transcription antitermination factor NusB [Candidatus Gottesmanbacteria bacterium RIFCSPLOWO2_01_FULL_42_22]OGG35704.1 MAG: transcripti
MKKSDDPRHQKRISIMQSLFSASFENKQFEKHSELSLIRKNLESIDKQIEESAPQFPIAKIAKLDAAILRLAVYELSVLKETPPKVIIDEAIELAKEFGSDTSPGFINGVLGTVYKKIYG